MGEDGFDDTIDQAALGATMPLKSTVPDGSGASSGTAFARGDTVDRYVVLDSLGEGAMGAVYAAYDPELDRRVALKVLHHETQTSSARSQGKGRLVREAKAMARLNHPNVIQVFDVGTLDDGDVFIAMEYIEGSTLTEWLAREARSPDEVLDVFRQAARGLAHAHESGVVHRDFKPDNCLIDEDGRVRVIDFGIARRAETMDEDALERASTGATAQIAELARTHAGMLIGTPAYMAFEQLEGREADARSDQFALGVSLYEALWGQAPFAGAGLLERMTEVMEGRVRPIPEGREVPEWIHPVVVRALATDPEDRWPSMEAMLEQLEPPEERRRSSHWVALGVGAVIAAVGVTFAIARWTEPTPRTPTCAGLEHHLEGVWDDARRAQIRRALARSDAAHASGTVERVLDMIDERAREWVAMRTDACEDTRIRGEVSEATMDLRMACLDRRLVEMNTTLEVLAETGPEAIDRATQLVSDLPSIARCGDIARLEADAANEPPPSLRERVQQLRQDRVRVKALTEAGAYEEAEARAEELLSAAREVGWDPIIAEALIARSRALVQRGRFRDARDAAFEAAWRADRAEVAHLEAEAWINVVFVVGSKLREREAGLRWAEFARAALERAGDDPLLRSRLEYYVGLSQKALGHYGEALEAFRAAERSQREVLEEGNWRYATTYGAQASALNALGRSEEAIAAYRRAVETMESSLGPEHPGNGALLNNYAIALRGAHRLEEARQTFERALELKRRTLGDEHPSVALTLANLGSVEQRLGNYERASELYEEARELRRRTLGESHALYTSTLESQASLALARGEGERAIELYEQVLRQSEAQGEAYPIASAQSALSHALYRAGRYREAERLVRQALVHYESEGLEAKPTAYPRTHLGAILVELGRPEEAIEPLGLALRARSEGSVDLEDRGYTRYALGRALFESGRDPRRGWDLVEAARDDFRQAGPPGAWAIERVEGWLEEHERPPIEDNRD